MFLTSSGVPLNGCIIGSRTEVTGRIAHLPFSSWRGLNYILSLMLLEHPASNQPEPRCRLWSSPLGHWQVLAHPQLLGTTMFKNGSLDNHKYFETQLGALAGLIDEVLLHRWILSRLREVVVLSNMQKPTQKVKEKEEKKGGYIPNKRTKSICRNYVLLFC